ncbi:MAG: hypothetical protein IJ348_01480 [Alistipes sp.]|nr:hypothetical protein [Alistipes sp.]
MRKICVIILALLVVSGATAQPLCRTEFAPFDTREDALERDYSRTVNHILYRPVALGVSGSMEMFGRVVSVPAAWNDYSVYLHVENTIKAYDVAVNGVVVASTNDPYTPADYLLSPYLRQGDNEVVLLLRVASGGELNIGAQCPLREQFENCYIYTQYRAGIYDYEAKILHEPSDNTLRLALDVVARNDFNSTEAVSIGYDIYSPENKLIDYGVRTLDVPGRGCDTLRVAVNLGAESRNLWRAGKPSLYRMTLYVKRGSKPTEYIPFQIGAGQTTFADGRIVRNGTPISIKSARYNARTSYQEAYRDIQTLKKQGVNTLLPDAPQPAWFYRLCDRLGVYVVERANINPTKQSDNRKVGGTLSNNPQLLDEYLSRVKAMYYRTRNHACIIAYALGGDLAGNGYCMYKAYEWLKGVEKSRAVICTSAEGEWNTDLDKIE